MNRIQNEIRHGKFISQKGEEIWNWSSPAGKIRWERRTGLFINAIGSNRNILEVGCGTGLFTKEIQHTNNKITAIDISPDLIEIAKKRISNPSVDLIVGNAYDTPFNDNSFDCIIGSSVLHHLDVGLAIKEFHRLLKPDGKILFTEPNMLNPQIAVQKNIPALKNWAGDSPDETAFIRWILKKQLEKAGFKNISIIPFDFLHPSTPNILLRLFLIVTKYLEKIPVIREFSGSLVICADK